MKKDIDVAFILKSDMDIEIATKIIKYAWLNGICIIVFPPNADNKKLEQELKKHITNYIYIDKADFEDSLSSIGYHWQENEVAFILYSSGSTGKPKAICHSHQNILRSVNFFTEAFNIKYGESILCLADISTMSGFRSLVIKAFYNIDIFFIKNSIVNHLIEKQYDYIICGPSVIDYFINVKRLIGNRLSGTKILSTGSSLYYQKIQKYETLYDSTIYRYYGLTETCGIVMAENDKTVLSSDSLPPLIKDVSVRLYPYKEGSYKLCVKTPNLFLGYLGDKFSHVKSFYYTGDLVKVCNDELIFIGRENRIFKTKDGSDFIFADELEVFLKKSGAKDVFLDIFNKFSNNAQGLTCFIQGIEVNKVYKILTNSNYRALFLNPYFNKLSSNNL
ncbi:AMP-binding protein [Allofrancisella guangzhouensis]|uniref:AMP-binding protein n=1 Tax=Allofrancisella guangzhouensis TaxID=594679 RepID=UPI0019070E3E|nr:AMP-binding protein [Allofrancisella guangzhouensis]MBK2044855.1 AMP-binding protein [Allofrancisella guangzhouensis]